MPIPARQEAAERVLCPDVPKQRKIPKPACARLTGFCGHPRRFMPNAAFASRVTAPARLARVERRAGDPEGAPRPR